MKLHFTTSTTRETEGNLEIMQQNSLSEGSSRAVIESEISEAKEIFKEL